MVNIIYNGRNYKEDKEINELINEAKKLTDEEEFDQILIESDKILKIDINNEKAYFIKGFTYNNMKMYKEAIENYNKVLEINPKNEKACNNKGNALKDLGKNEEAELCFEKYRKLKKSLN